MPKPVVYLLFLSIVLGGLVHPRFSKSKDFLTDPKVTHSFLDQILSDPYVEPRHVAMFEYILKKELRIFEDFHDGLIKNYLVMLKEKWWELSHDLETGESKNLSSWEKAEERKRLLDTIKTHFEKRGAIWSIQNKEFVQGYDSIVQMMGTFPSQYILFQAAVGANRHLQSLIHLASEDIQSHPDSLRSLIMHLNPEGAFHLFIFLYANKQTQHLLYSFAAVYFVTRKTIGASGIHSSYLGKILNPHIIQPIGLTIGFWISHVIQKLWVDPNLQACFAGSDKRYFTACEVSYLRWKKHLMQTYGVDLLTIFASANLSHQMIYQTKRFAMGFAMKAKSSQKIVQVVLQKTKFVGSRFIGGANIFVSFMAFMVVHRILESVVSVPWKISNLLTGIYRNITYLEKIPHLPYKETISKPQKESFISWVRTFVGPQINQEAAPSCNLSQEQWSEEVEEVFQDLLLESSSENQNLQQKQVCTSCHDSKLGKDWQLRVQNQYGYENYKEMAWRVEKELETLKDSSYQFSEWLAIRSIYYDIAYQTWSTLLLRVYERYINAKTLLRRMWILSQQTVPVTASINRRHYMDTFLEGYQTADSLFHKVCETIQKKKISLSQKNDLRWACKHRPLPQTCGSFNYSSQHLKFIDSEDSLLDSIIEIQLQFLQKKGFQAAPRQEAFSYLHQEPEGLFAYKAYTKGLVSLSSASQSFVSQNRLLSTTKRLQIAMTFLSEVQQETHFDKTSFNRKKLQAAGSLILSHILQDYTHRARFMSPPDVEMEYERQKRRKKLLHLLSKTEHQFLDSLSQNIQISKKEKYALSSNLTGNHESIHSNGYTVDDYRMTRSHSRILKDLLCGVRGRLYEGGTLFRPCFYLFLNPTDLLQSR